MKLYIIAGEASGDLHGSNLIKQLMVHEPSLVVRCWGGNLMQQAGGELVKHYRDLAFMGFVEVAANLRTILHNISFCKQDILAFSPNAIVLIDYPGFNLRIAQFAHQHNIKVFYYISPQVWAWHSSRVQTMRLVIDHLYVILPFEKAFFETHDMPNVSYYGHPLLDAIEQKKQVLQQVLPIHLGLPNNKPIVALLPGSRRQELLSKLPTMLSVVKHFPDYRFVIAATETLPAALYYSIMQQYGEADIVYNRTYELLHLSTAALVTSGTATLETALLNIPQVVCYRANAVSYYIAKRLVDLKYISLVNLIMDKEVVTELIQRNLTTENLQKELQIILPNNNNNNNNNNTKRPELLQHYQQLRNLLGGVGASERVALSMLDKLR